MRLIDADALIPLIQEDKIEGKTLDIVKALGDGLQAETLNQACDRHIKIISSLPTIDAVPVVRCKECGSREPVVGTLDWCVSWHRHVSPDGFCDIGERKDNG